MLQMFFYILNYIFFINLPINSSIYLFIHSFIHSSKNSRRVLNKWRAEPQQKGKIQLNLLVPFLSQYFLLCFYRFYWFIYFLESAIYASY